MCVEPGRTPFKFVTRCVHYLFHAQSTLRFAMQGFFIDRRVKAQRDDLVI